MPLTHSTSRSTTVCRPCPSMCDISIDFLPQSDHHMSPRVGLITNALGMDTFVDTKVFRWLPSVRITLIEPVPAQKKLDNYCYTYNSTEKFRKLFWHGMTLDQKQFYAIVAVKCSNGWILEFRGRR